jgi:hypothetical protein
MLNVNPLVCFLGDAEGAFRARAQLSLPRGVDLGWAMVRVARGDGRAQASNQREAKQAERNGTKRILEEMMGRVETPTMTRHDVRERAGGPLVVVIYWYHEGTGVLREKKCIRSFLDVWEVRGGGVSIIDIISVSSASEPVGQDRNRSQLTTLADVDSMHAYIIMI